MKNFGGDRGTPKKDWVDDSTIPTEDPEGEPEITFKEKYQMIVNGKQMIEIVEGNILEE